MKSTKIFMIMIIPLLVFTSCGSPNVDITSSSYSPKIVVEGYLFCNETVKDFRLTRNFRLNNQLEGGSLILTPSQNDVVITINGIPLTYDESKKTYYNSNLKIEYGRTYKLDVSANIDGNQLHTTSITTTPQKGFSIINKDLGSIKYRLAKPTIQFTPSPGTNLYAFSIMPDSASLRNFIYDNPYEPNKDTTDLVKDFNSYRFQYEVIKDINSNSSSTFQYSVEGYDSWFYGSYTVTVYAGDSNFGYYLLTANNVKEMDGNFHEPIQIFEGDGIGVFGSAIKETVKFSLIK